MSLAALGIDVGSTTVKLVGVDSAGAMVFRHLEDAHPRIEEQSEKLLSEAAGGLAEIPVVSTGYGRNLVRRAGRKVTEITCHARGVFRSVNQAGTLIDIGGQDSKVIVIGKDGAVVSFSMNDKCAAGTGRFLEVVAGRLKLSMEQLSEAALAQDQEAPISSTCTVFAESEIISLLARGTPLEQIVRGLHRSLLKRVSALARGAGLRPPVLLSGGVARSRAIREILGAELGQVIQVPEHPQLMGAYGAALSALSRST